MKRLMCSFAVLLLLLFACGCHSQQQSAEDAPTFAYSGWAYGERSGVLRISDGSLLTAQSYPWTQYADHVKKVIIEEADGIGDGAFAFFSALQTAELPSGITYIGENAFSGCYSLQEITLCAPLQRIGARAFFECRSLQSLILPASLTEIGEQAFACCTSLSQIESRSDSFAVADKMLFNADKTQLLLCSAAAEGDITVPDGVLHIAERAFAECNVVQSVTLPAGLLSVGSYAFSQCRMLTSVTLPASLQTLGEGAFCLSEQLQSMVIPDAVKELPDSLFFACTQLQNVHLPSALEKIGVSAFAECISLQKADFAGNIKAVAVAEDNIPLTSLF